MPDYQAIIQNAVAAVQQKGLEVTVARVKHHLTQPVPMGFLMPAVHALREQEQEVVDIEQIQPPETPQLTPEVLLEEINQLQQRVAQLETELQTLKSKP